MNRFAAPAIGVVAVLIVGVLISTSVSGGVLSGKINDTGDVEREFAALQTMINEGNEGRNHGWMTDAEFTQLKTDFDASIDRIKEYLASLEVSGNLNEAQRIRTQLREWLRFRSQLFGAEASTDANSSENNQASEQSEASQSSN